MHKPSPADDLVDLARALDITPSSIEARLGVIGLGPADRQLLRAVAPAIAAQEGPFIDALYERFLQQPELSPLLIHSTQIQRLKGMQRRYLRELLLDPLDLGYALGRLRVGAAHYRVRLTPQWYLATYAHFVCEHIPLLLRTAASLDEGVARLVALLRSAFFDATLALDAYGLSEELALRARAATQVTPPPLHSPDGEWRPLSTPRERGHALTRLKLTEETVEQRRTYVGLSAAHVARLPSLADAIARAVPEVLRDFYALLQNLPAAESRLPAEAIPRLLEQVAAYWRELIAGRFDLPYATSRMRSGLVHERIGLGPRWYFTGLARQAAQLLPAIAAAAADPAAALDAFLRAVFFDTMYVMDAYLQARAETLLRTDGYANQLVSGLSSAVVIVDPGGRILSVNATMRDLLQCDAGLLYRMPLQQALPLPEVAQLIERLRSAPLSRAEAFVRVGVPLAAPSEQRLCRITAVQLDPWRDGKGQSLALVIDDLTQLLRVATAAEQNEDRCGALLNTVDAALWELDTTTWTVQLMSAQALSLTGYRDVYFVGRSQAWTDCVAAADRERFRSACAALSPGARGQCEHRLVRADGREVWARSHLRRPAGGGAVVTGVTVDITSERLAEQRARERDQAVQHSQAKSQFLAHMSHEIRTPMSGVLGMTRLVLEGELSPEQREHLQMVLCSAESLLSIINDILDLSKIEAGRMTLERTAFDLRLVCDESIGVLWVRARDKGVALRSELALGAAGPVWCFGDPVRLRQVLLNLLGNALKFTERGAVELRVEAAPGGVYRFSVRDTGIGIPAERQAHIFEPFEQADETTTRRYGGTGLGLSISRDLVQLMGGQLGLESAPGVGSTFFFAVELPHAAAPEAQAAAAAAAGPTVPVLRVLVAEDNDINARIVVKLLQRLGHEVERVADGAEAVRRWEAGRFDLVLMDMQMPVLDGLGATRAIREVEAQAGGHVPIVALTASAMSEDAERCRAAGMDGHLSKPIEARALQSALLRHSRQALHV